MGVPETVRSLFDLIDTDSNGSLDFGEVTSLFKQLEPGQSHESAQRAAAEAMILSDRDTDTRLTLQEFAALLAKLAELSGLPTAEAAQRLLQAAQRQKQRQQQQQQGAEDGEQQHDQEEAPPQQLTSPAAAAVVEAAAASEPAHIAPSPPPPAQSPADPPAAAAADSGPSAHKLQQLFALWDTSSSGRLTFAELCQGLAKLQRPLKSKQDITSLITEAATVLAVHDADGDGQLSGSEFSAFICGFMEAAGFACNDVLVDDLLLLHQHKADSQKLQRVLDSAQPQLDGLLAAANR